MLCKLPLPLATGAIPGSDGNIQVLTDWFRVSEWEGHLYSAL